MVSLGVRRKLVHCVILVARLMCRVVNYMNNGQSTGEKKIRKNMTT